jgi:methylmalonyl-CoA/ethylmalonyl-CoA epimerase
MCSSRRYRAADDTREATGTRPVEENLTRDTLPAALTAYDDGSMALLPENLVTAIDHVGVAVADLDGAMAFYRDVFGLETVHVETNEEQGVREAMVRVGPEGDGSATMIQLLAPVDAESTIAKFLDRHGPGLQQLAYRVTDLEAVSAVLRERGVRLLYDEGRPGTAGSRVNFVHPKDAGGVLVELVEPVPPRT